MLQSHQLCLCAAWRNTFLCYVVVCLYSVRVRVRVCSKILMQWMKLGKEKSRTNSPRYVQQALDALKISIKLIDLVLCVLYTGQYTYIYIERTHFDLT